MTPNERHAVDNLKTKIDQERLRAECPCVRTLLVILSKGLDAIGHADNQQPRHRRTDACNGQQAQPARAPSVKPGRTAH